MFRDALERKRAELPATLAIDDTGPACDAFFAAPDADAERAWKRFRGVLRAELARVPGLAFLGATEPGATHLLTARLDESKDRSFALLLELVDMRDGRIVWRARRTGKLAD
jgi:hypothetical protein